MEIIKEIPELYYTISIDRLTVRLGLALQTAPRNCVRLNYGYGMHICCQTRYKTTACHTVCTQYARY